MFLEDQEDNDIINFDEYAPNPIFPDIAEKDNGATTREKIVKNQQFLKNLGQNAAFYSDEHKIDLNQFHIENKQPQQQNDNIIIHQKNENDDFESVIQFQEIADAEEENKIENAIPSPKLQQSTNQQQIDQEEHNEEQLAAIPQIQNSMVSNASTISAYPIVNKDIEFIWTKEFLSSPIQENGIVQCQLLVNTSGLNKLSPKFYLERNGKIFLAAKHDSNKYVISMNKDKISRDTSNFMGLVSCENKHNYFLYDDGFNPKKKKLPVRTQIGHVKFIAQQKVSEPRQQEVRFPLKQGYFANRKPKWNEKNQCFMLNFYERVKISSIKNFQLIKADEVPEQIYVQFGKFEEYKFNLDFSAPFSPLLAFMVALVNYDKKIEY